MKNAMLRTKDFFGNILYTVDSKINPTFGAKMHVWSRLIARLMLWVGIPLMTIVLVSIGAASSVTAGNWTANPAFVKTAVWTSAFFVSGTAFMYMVWFYFSKWDVNKEEKK